ncbi:MAG: hypothetical protein GY804_14145 [Alphaproteobacteria bacterium]|nr:hypothetical protein [Alphaproteobacteria bacterium]
MLNYLLFKCGFISEEKRRYAKLEKDARKGNINAMAELAEEYLKKAETLRTEAAKNGHLGCLEEKIRNAQTPKELKEWKDIALVKISETADDGIVIAGAPREMLAITCDEKGNNVQWYSSAPEKQR